MPIIFRIFALRFMYVIRMSQIYRHITLISLLLPLSLFALDIDYRFSLRSGMIMPDAKVETMLGQPEGTWCGPSLSGEFAVTFRPNWQSLTEWNDARIGAALSYWKLDLTRSGSSDLLGHAIAPYAFIEVPFYRSPHFIVGVRPGFGFAFVTKTYYNTATPEQLYVTQLAPNINQSIGSVFNYFFPEAFYMTFPIRGGWSLGLSAGWYHMSNGSMRKPNSGYNIFGGDLTLCYRPEDDTPRPADQTTQEYSLEALRKHHCEIELGFIGAPRQVFYKDRKTFFCSEIQLAAYWRAHRIFRLGGGVDIFYDGAYYDRPTEYGKTYLTGATQADCWRVGVSLQPEFVVGHFSAGFHLGIYLYDPVKNREVATKDKAAYAALWNEGVMPRKGIFYSYDLLNAGSPGYPDGFLYTQVNMRYRLPHHLFIQGVMKSHLTKVEFIGLGLGVYL